MLWRPLRILSKHSTRNLAMSARPGLRVAVVQYTPIWADVERNIKRVEGVTARIQPGTVDLVCLPEMCFSGYAFPDPSQLKPLLESPNKGLTASFCARLARRLGCNVIAGYPELPDGKSEDGKIGYNSAMVYGPEGLVHNYRKYNLFEMDLPWASPGHDFTLLPTPIAGLTTALAICNDLNPPVNLGEWCIQNDVRLLIVICAWLKSEASKEGEPETQTDLDELEEGAEAVEERAGDEGVTAVLEAGMQSGQRERQQRSGREWDRQNVAYWLYRLSDMLLDGENTERFVVICNRTGTEHGSTFAGSSTMWKFMGNARFQTVGRLPSRVEGVGIWEV
ncbi:carbon-nitrogen hydrolase [Calocera cornea HHB12733]|uniref:Carbon-nitrogen hydrolase n=1 Tax=Calocera cornea HHB12733 TaxID=1353952 RepID=A0A165D339_9BASI|nr:carbon-nitrogen hydrolase [Calocera cornea HHB12733]